MSESLCERVRACVRGVRAVLRGGESESLCERVRACGGFSLAVKALHEKARRAFYAIKSRFGK